MKNYQEENYLDIGIMREKGFISNNDHPGQGKEFMGAYLFAEVLNSGVLVGISKSVYRRLKQHVWGQKHNQASWNYLMAREKHRKANPDWETEGRENFPFESYRDKSRSYIEGMRLTLLPIKNETKMYMFEPFCACYLQTYWNSFGTH